MKNIFYPTSVKNNYCIAFILDHRLIQRFLLLSYPGEEGDK